MRINTIQTLEPGGVAYIKNFTFEKLAAAPTGVGLWTGRVWFNTTGNVAKYFDGTTVVSFPSGTTASDIGNYVGSSATYAGLPTLDADGSALEGGDIAILTADDGANVSGWYAYNAGGPSWDLVKQIDNPGVASTTAAGLVELATNAEATAGTSTTLAITPAALAAVLAGRAGSALIGDGSVGPFTVAHNVTGMVLNERLIVQIEDVATGETVEALWDNNATSITVSPVGPVASSAYRVTWIKAA